MTPAPPREPFRPNDTVALLDFVRSRCSGPLRPTLDVVRRSDYRALRWYGLTGEILAVIYDNETGWIAPWVGQQRQRTRYLNLLSTLFDSYAIDRIDPPDDLRSHPALQGSEPVLERPR